MSKMQLQLVMVPIRDLVNGYVNNDEEGVVGYSGRLNIRPKYQRNFVYDVPERNAVIITVNRGRPLNVIYWSVNKHDDPEVPDTYEVLDGQQRIVSICEYVEGNFSVEDHNGNPQYFDRNRLNDPDDEFLNYELMVYFCTGSEEEKIEWFKTINIANKPLTNQELRNAIYSGSWVTDAKRYFSKNGCPAQSIGGKYLSGSANRQELLETAIDWISRGDIEDYMALNRRKTSADPLWQYFQQVIEWIATTFPDTYKEMKSVDWHPLYLNYSGQQLNPIMLGHEIKELLKNKEVQKKKGIWPYVLTRREKHLNLRSFDDDDKRQKLEDQDYKCAICDDPITMEECEADHITSWDKGGKTELDNCQVTCMPCNREKSNK